MNDVVPHQHVTAARSAVRPATEADLRRVAEIRTISWQSAYRGIVDDETLDALDVDVEAERWEGGWSVFPRHGMTLLVADTGDTIAGYILVKDRNDTNLGDDVGELMALYLEPAAWGSGAGQALIDAGVGVLRDAGCQAATLWVFAANSRARRFYERNGWTPDGAVDTWNGQDEVRYRVDW